MEIIWKPQAEKDLTAIQEFYLSVAPELADIIIDQIIHRTRHLELNPQSGRIVPELNDPLIREVIYRNYRIIYYHNTEEQSVEILTVFHSTKQFGT
jgi:toxin ParE1/3/4